MPRSPKLRYRQPTGAQVVPVRLSAEAHAGLASILNRDTAPPQQRAEIAASIEGILAMHAVFSEIDGQPRPSQRLREIRPLRNAARALLKRFRNLSLDAHQDILNQAAHGKEHATLSRFPSSLTRMTQTLEAACQHLTVAESRGGPTGKAMKVTVDALAHLFNCNYQRQDDDADQASLRLDFIEEALTPLRVSMSPRHIARILAAPCPFI